MTFEDVKNVTFETVRKGYRAEDVDDFLMQTSGEMEHLLHERNNAISEKNALQEQLEQISEERNAALRAKDDLEDKLYVLAAKVEEYRGQEDTLKTALINAQRMGETVVFEAKQKAEQKLHEATGQAELLKAKAMEEAEMEKAVLNGLIEEVNRFKSTILNLYKQHIESLSALDSQVLKAEKVASPKSENFANATAAKPQSKIQTTAVKEAEVYQSKAHSFGLAPKAPLNEPKLFEGELLDE
jgi:cell division initiation protein